MGGSAISRSAIVLGEVGSPPPLGSGDVDGVVILAVQALARRVDELRDENATLAGRLEPLERRLADRPALAAAPPGP